MISWVIGLALSATQLPTALAAELAKLQIDEVIESTTFAADNHIQPAFKDSARIVYSPASQSRFEHVLVVQCQHVAAAGARWVCNKKRQWRINGAAKIYIQGNDSINRWIAQHPVTALTPYLGLISHAQSIYPNDAYQQPLAAISIDDDGATAIYASFGSGCQTAIKIRSSLKQTGVQMRLDLATERSFCI